MTKRIFALLLAVLLAVSCFALTACGGEEEKKPADKPVVDEPTGNEPGGNEPGGNEPTGPVAPSVVIYNETITLVEDDEPYGADQWVFVSGEGEITTTYTSSDEAVFTVSADGTITPVAPGTAKVTVSAKVGDLETKKEANVQIREIWNPTDPISKEVVEIMRNKELINAPLSFYNSNYSTNKDWGTGNDPDAPQTTGGPVEIWGEEPHLQFLFVIPKAGDNTIDATVGFKEGDLSEYHFSFKFFVREQNLEDDRTDYKCTTKNLQPWSIYGDPTLTIYRATFYDSGLLDIVEEGKTYEVVVVVYEDETPRAWAASTMNWTDSCTKYIEKALENADVVK
jgi:hypothetical protein